MSGGALFLGKGEGGGEPYPPRDGCRVTPLIEAAEMYPVLEREILKAETNVWIAFRVFDPTTKLRSEEARAAGFETWIDLLEDAVRRGVEVRMLLTDFEPVMADHLHAESWASFHALKERMDGLPEAVRAHFQMIVIQHEGEIGWSWRQLLRLSLRKRIRRKIEKLLGGGDSAEMFRIRPGLWRWLGWDADRPSRWRPGPPPRLWPATYHQKCAIIDGSRAVMGGLDLDERRWDDRRHRQRADETWHDVSSLVEGPIACDAADHFVSLWNEALPRFREIVGEWTEGSGRALDLDPLDAIDACPSDDSARSGDARCQLVRTRSRHSASAFAAGPVAHIRELEEAHRRIIFAARRCLYIEAQFFRSKRAANWLIEALRRNPALEVILLLANVPEEIAFEGQKRHPVHKHGEYLQARALGRILKAGGTDRVGLFTLVKPRPADTAERRYDNSRGTAYGSGVIHIHAKLVMADTDACLLSSANINGRSFEWDTELGLLWSEEGDAIADFRRRLWSQLFDARFATDPELADWHHIAERNRTAEPSDRQGFVVPYQRGRARRYGNPYFWIPDRLV